MEDNDPHKRMRRFGELCGYFYGRRFFGLETIMSDRDSDHMLLELQEARAEIDRLRDLLRWRVFKEEKPDKFNCYFISDGCDIAIGHWCVDESWLHGVALKYWRPIGPLPGGE